MLRRERLPQFDVLQPLAGRVAAGLASAGIEPGAPDEAGVAEARDVGRVVGPVGCADEAAGVAHGHAGAELVQGADGCFAGLGEEARAFAGKVRRRSRLALQHDAAPVIRAERQGLQAVQGNLPVGAQLKSQIQPELRLAAGVLQLLFHAWRQIQLGEAHALRLDEAHADEIAAASVADEHGALRLVGLGLGLDLEAGQAEQGQGQRQDA